MNDTTDDRTLRELMGRIDEVRTMGAKAQAVAKAFAEREQELRDEILEHMNATDTRHALVGDMSAVIRTVRRVEVTDEGMLLNAITEAGVLDDYMTFNTSRAKADAVAREWPGVSVREQCQLVLSKREATR